MCQCQCITEKNRQIEQLQEEVRKLKLTIGLRKLLKMPENEREALQLLHQRERADWSLQMASLREQRDRCRQAHRYLVAALVVAFVPACAGTVTIAQQVLRLWW